MNIKEALAKTTTARRVTVTIDPVGDVLFVEPTIADLNEAQKRFMCYRLKSGGKGDPVVELDTEKSDMDGYNRTLVALTVRDPATLARAFEGPEEVSASFSAVGEDGAPLHGSELFGKFVEGANQVCGAPDKKDAEKN